MESKQLRNVEKLIINDTYDYFIKQIQPKLQRQKIQDPFDNYESKTLNYYNRSVFDAMGIPTNVSESDRVAKSRAFNLAKKKVFFNPDLQFFITLTYAENMQDYQKLRDDMRQFLQTERRNSSLDIKYIWVVEKQKRGALHVHLISNTSFTTILNQNGYKQLTNWMHGFSSVLSIDGTDGNFKPYLYLFKYIKKSQKIGGRYVHSSRNLNNFDEYTDFKFDSQLKNHLLQEKSYMGSVDRLIKRDYYNDINKGV